MVRKDSDNSTKSYTRTSTCVKVPVSACTPLGVRVAAPRARRAGDRHRANSSSCCRHVGQLREGRTLGRVRRDCAQSEKHTVSTLTNCQTFHDNEQPQRAADEKGRLRTTELGPETMPAFVTSYGDARGPVGRETVTPLLP